MASSRPNILFIVIDSARPDHFGVYGHTKATTPFLGSAISDLALYMDASAPAAWTRPAMTSIFTGLYPQQYDFFNDHYPERDVALLSEILRRQGYRTIALSNNPYMSPSTGFDRGMDVFYFVYPGRFLRVFDPRVVIRNLPIIVRQYLNRRASLKFLPQMINDQAKVLLRRAGADGRPFFMYIHHDAHHPYLSDRGYLRPFMEPGVTEAEIRLVENVQKSGNMYWFSRETHSPAQRERYYAILRAMHDASISRNDLFIEELVDTLKAMRIYDDTMIVVTADHGEFLGEKNLVSHGLYPYEESVRVPLIVKFPKECGIAGRLDRLVSTIDIAPTMVELAGTDVREHVAEAQGLSLLGDNLHEFVVTERRNFAKGLDYWKATYPDHRFEDFDYGCMISLKTAGRKFVWSSKGKHALFDRESDPQETANLYHPDDARSKTYLNRACEWMERVPKVGTGATAELDEKIRQHLRGLGYLE
jgi:arylsulfatase A-like enzyme